VTLGRECAAADRKFHKVQHKETNFDKNHSYPAFISYSIYSVWHGRRCRSSINWL